VEHNDNEKEFAVDYSGIDDVDRPYTLDKLIKGGGTVFFSLRQLIACI